MKLSQALLALVLLAAALPAAAQDTGATSFTLETVTEGSGGYFQIQGATARNPTLVVPASAAIAVTLVGTDDGVHNIQVDGQSASEFVQAAGETVEYSFTSPASGTVEYWCVPHKAAGMRGIVRVAGSPEPTPPDGGNGAPGLPVLGVALALLATALLLQRRR